MLRFMGSQRVRHDWATELNCCSISSSNCCFLICIQISQEEGQVVCDSNLLHNFAEIVVIHTVKGFGIVNKAEIDVFLELSCFFDDPTDVANLSSGSSAFSKSSLNIWKSMVHVLLKPGLENSEHYFATMWDECNCAVVWAFFGIAFLCDWNENSFSSPWPILSFPNLLVFECSTFRAPSFRIWNSLTWIPSSPLALFTVALPKAHLTSLSRISGSRWVITPSWLSGLWRSFLYSSSVHSCHLFLISSASVRSIQFLSFILPIFAWKFPLVSLIFLKKSLIFPILLFSDMFLHWFLGKVFLSVLVILWNSAFKWVYLSFFFFFAFFFSSFHSCLVGA